jgi:DNA-binding response OmpR family regulator
LKVLLVVDKEDARSKRLAELLKRSGMAPKVTTYAKVTANTCDAHDVVLADSKLFRKNEKGSIGRARGFPKTKSPIVAVGFLGTELIEGQKIAMTSGYI